jgi:large subunit ribosomal protein L1
MAKPGKRMKELRAQVDPTRAYPLDQAITLLKGCAKAKFDESI